MGLFVIIESGGDQLDKPVAEAFPTDFLKLSNTAWLVSAPPTMTSKEVWERVSGNEGTPERPQKQGIVFAFSGYFGLAPASIWEWIGVRRSKE